MPGRGVGYPCGYIGHNNLLGGPAEVEECPEANLGSGAGADSEDVKRVIGS
jgi:hypothetical protein